MTRVAGSWDLSHPSHLSHPPYLLFQPERQQLRTIVRAADREDDVLPALVHVGNGRPGLPRRHLNRADVGACRLVVRAKQRAALAGGVRVKAKVTGDDERLRDECADERAALAVPAAAG